MPSSTPVRVRGKRNAAKDEKWNHGRQRKAARIPSEHESSQRPRRKQQAPDLSRLETLPTEILHHIFELSTNMDLALASPRLATQLASQHLYSQLTSQVFECLVSRERDSRKEAKEVLRLTNSKFFTWFFFREWLREEYSSPYTTREWGDANKSGSVNPSDDELKEWWLKRLSSNVEVLLPPAKLFRGPFTHENVRFLTFMTSRRPDSFVCMDPIYRELAEEGLKQAIKDGAEEAVELLLSLLADRDVEILRFAVIDAGCNKRMVSWIMDGHWYRRGDVLDPVIWSWAQRARSRGDEKGAWLIELLKRRARAEYSANTLEDFVEDHPMCVNLESSEK